MCVFPEDSFKYKCSKEAVFLLQNWKYTEKKKALPLIQVFRTEDCISNTRNGEKAEAEPNKYDSATVEVRSSQSSKVFLRNPESQEQD